MPKENVERIRTLIMKKMAKADLAPEEEQALRAWMERSEGNRAFVERMVN